MSDIGNRIRERRLELELTQEELAHRIGYKTKSSINKLETSRDIPIKKLKPIADALNIDIKALMGWEEEAPRSPENAALLADVIKDRALLEHVKTIKALEPDKRAQVYSYIDFIATQK